MKPSQIISCDWGTTSLRLRLATRDDQRIALAEYRSGQGASVLAADADEPTRAQRFEATLRHAIGQLAAQVGQSLHDLPIVISGMASSSIGWKSLPYATLPFALDGTGAVTARMDFAEHRVLLISGVRDDNDVMRGEETELIGLMQTPEAIRFGGRCVAILPGTHSKHATIVDGKLRSFRTMMTGELFSVLATHSVLRHSVRKGEQAIVMGEASDPASAGAFVVGVKAAQDLGVLGALFKTRTRQLLNDEPETRNAAYLSGVLIGGELVALAQLLSQTEPLVLCAGSAVADWYQLAIRTAGIASPLVQVPAAVVDQLSVYGHLALALSLGG